MTDLCSIGGAADHFIQRSAALTEQNAGIYAFGFDDPPANTVRGESLARRYDSTAAYSGPAAPQLLIILMLRFYTPVFSP